MTNPIKRFFQIIKEIVLFPISFLQVRRAYQEMEKIRRLPKDPNERRKFLRKMGLDEEMFQFFETDISQQYHDARKNVVDLSYLEGDDEEDLEELDE